MLKLVSKLVSKQSSVPYRKCTFTCSQSIKKPSLTNIDQMFKTRSRFNMFKTIG